MSTRRKKQTAGMRPAVSFDARCSGGGFLEQLLELAALVHLGHDVRASDEFAVDVELRDGRPVGVFLDALAYRGIFQHVHREKFVHAARAQDSHRVRRESALGEIGGAFHVEHDPVSGHLLSYNFLITHVFYKFPSETVNNYFIGWEGAPSNRPPETRSWPARSRRVAACANPWAARSTRAQAPCR